jgi:putative copper export protein
MELKKTLNAPMKGLVALILSIFTSLYTFAQDVPEKVEVDINTDGGSVWYGQPWVWAIGIAIFIVVLVLITRSNKSSAQ